MSKTVSLLVVAMLTMGATSAFAVDMHVNPPMAMPDPTVYVAQTPQPMPAPVAMPAPTSYDFTGTHIGATFGGALHSAHFDDSTFSGTSNPNSALGGLDVGFDFQSGQFVYGVETDVNSSTLNSKARFGSAVHVITHSDQLPFFGTARGVLGFAVDRGMVYGTGGLAYGFTNDKYNYVDANGNLSGGSSNIQAGYALGAGVRYAVMPNWIVSVEYMHMELGSQTYNANDALSYYTPFSVKGTVVTDLVRGGIAYKW